MKKNKNRHKMKKINKNKIKKQPQKVEPLFKHQMPITAALVFLIVVATFGGSYAVFSTTKTSDEYNVVQVGDIELSYVDLSAEGNTLTLNNAYPVSDSVGSTGSSYRFSVENTGSITSNYKIVITDDMDVIESDGCSSNLVDKQYVRYKFNNNAVGTLSNLYNQDEQGYVIYTGTLNAGDSDIHEIRLWLNETSLNNILGVHYHGKVNVIIEQAKV